MKQTTKARLLCALLAAAMLLPACGEAKPTETTAPADTTAAPVAPITTEATTPVPETTKHPDADNLPDDLDFEDKVVTFYVRGHERFDDEISVDGTTGEIVNDTIYNRELRTEERLGVKIETIRDQADAHGDLDAIRKAVNTNDDTYDIFSASVCRVLSSTTSGIFRELNDLEYIDLSRPYYTQDYLKKTAIHGKNHTVTGDISLSLTRYSFCMYFNKTLLDTYKLEDPYALVRDGKWTHAKMLEMITDIYSDLNGNNQADNEDLYGLGTSNDILVDAYTVAYDLPMIALNSDGHPELVVNVEKFADVTEKVYRINFETTGAHQFDYYGDNAEMTDLCMAFSQDRLAFMHSWIYGMETEYLRNMSSDFGVLPYPKYDENQESYYSFQHDQIGVFALPTSSDCPEVAGAVLEAMSADSRINLVPAYYDTALKNKYSRDVDTAEMIDIVHNNHNFDISWGYINDLLTLPQGIRNLIKAKNPNYASWYASREKMLGKKMDSIAKNYDKMK